MSQPQPAYLFRVWFTEDLQNRVSTQGLRNYLVAVFSEFHQRLIATPCVDGIQVDLALLPGAECLVEVQNSRFSDSDLDELHADLKNVAARVATPHVVAPVAGSMRYGRSESDFEFYFEEPFIASFDYRGEAMLDAILRQRCHTEQVLHRRSTSAVQVFPRVARWFKKLFTSIGGESRTKQVCPVSSAFDNQYRLEDAGHWLSVLDGHLAEAPECASSYARRGKVHFEWGAYAEAIVDLSRALELDTKELNFRLFYRGVARARAHHIESALDDFDRIIATNADHVPTLTERASLYSQLKNWSAAKQDIDSAIHHAPLDFDVRLAAAQILSNAGETVSAVDAATVAIRLDPNTEQGYGMRGLIRMRSSSRQDRLLAIEDFTTAIRINPSNPHGYFYRAQLQGALGARIDAREDIDKALTLDPEMLGAFYVRADICAELGDFQGVIANMDLVLKRKEASDAYARRGIAHLNLDHRDEASADFRAARAINPNDAMAIRGEGLLQLQYGDVGEALTSFSTAIKYAPTWGVLYADRADCHRIENDEDAAISDYSQAIKLDAALAVAYLKRGAIYANRGATKRAWDDFTAAISCSPENAHAYLFRARCELGAHDLEAAGSDLDQAIRLKPAFVDALLSRGWLRLQQDNLQGAVEDMTRVIREQPSCSEAFVGRSWALAHLGEADCSASDLSEALRNDPSRHDEWEARRLVDEASRHYRKDDFVESLRLADEALTRDPQSLGAMYIRGAAHWYLDNLVEAAEEYSRIVEMDGNAVAALNNRGQIYAEMGEGEMALADLDRVETLMAHQYHMPRQMAYVCSGRALAKSVLGQTEEAMQEFERSVSLCGENAWVYYRLGLLYNQIGQRHQATICLHLALHITEPKLPATHRRRALAYLDAWGVPSPGNS